MNVQQSRRLTAEEETDELIRKINFYKDAELQMLGRARRAEDECARLERELANLKFMGRYDNYVVTLIGGRRIYGRKEDVETIRSAIDAALSRGCNHCSASIASARERLGS